MKNFLFITACLFAVLSVAVFLSLYGSKNSGVLDMAGLLVRRALHYPIQTFTNNLPASPDSRYQLTHVRRQWCWGDAMDFSTYELIGRRDGALILNGADLTAFNNGRSVAALPAHWRSQRVVAFESSRKSNGSTVPLIVQNNTKRTVTSLMLASHPATSYLGSADEQYHLVLDLAAGAREQFDCQILPVQTWLTCWVETGKLSNHLQLPSQSASSIQRILVTILEGQAPTFELVPRPKDLNQEAPQR